ncbi:SMI1/KNR4 family protein [Arachnia propionica]|uniref:Uncharacterized protein n=1 Tax=Arachnia propionica TaxID=1750 RepID=A0A3P1WW91_9ACTN|nr:SMI1/KNR4 family protein [Arachnia propionica]RRD50829.1 hypothetical protein EII35_03635 [Arachnia propionica]
MTLPLDDITGQAERIRRKLAVARLVDHFRDVSGAASHDYVLHPPLGLDAVRRFETTRRITLPEAYVRFVTKVGDGGPRHPGHTNDGLGAGPGHGIIPLEHEEHSWQETITPGEVTDDEWRSVFHGADRPDRDILARIQDAVLPVSEGGCGAFHGLILCGPLAGSVIHAMSDGDFLDAAPEIVADDFLAWYETWLDHVLGDGVPRAWRDPGRGPGQLFDDLEAGVADDTAARRKRFHLQLIGGLPGRGPEQIALLQEYRRTAGEERVRDHCLALLAQFDPEATRPLLDQASDALLIHILATRAPSLIPSFTDRLNQIHTKSQDLADAVDLIRHT